MGQNEQDGIDRRGALECMIWAGTGVLWTMVGGVPRSSSLLGISEANAQVASGFTFLQISDSHIGFKAPANPNPMATLDEAIAKIGALPEKPAFMIHTGDITHLSKPEEFDNADQAITKARLDTFYVPGEHDVVDADLGKAYMERYGKRVQAKGTGWYSFDKNGVHFVGLVNVANLKSGGMGILDADRAVCPHPAMDCGGELGLGNRRCRPGARPRQAFRLSDGAQRPYPSAHAEGGGRRDVPHRPLHGLPATCARHRTGTRPDAGARRQAAHRPRHHQRCGETGHAASCYYGQRTRQGVMSRL